MTTFQEPPHDPNGSKVQKYGCAKPYTSKDKWCISLILGILFVLIASPFFYKVINNLTKKVKFVTATNTGRPNVLGLLLHGLIYILVVRWLIK